MILIEGSANLAVLALKLVSGLATGSLAILADAVHSLTDLANNAVAWFVMRLSAKPADRDHPYGHRKFETLAVFVLASLLVVLAIELALGALRRSEAPVVHEGWSLALMLGVLALNAGVSTWESRWARRLGSDLLAADARHTLSDVLITGAVIAGWQLASRGYPWIDTACALGVAGLVLYLAWGLLRRVIPVLVDEAAVDPETVHRLVGAVPGVQSVHSVRSRWKGSTPALDMVVTVDGGLSMNEAHAIADAIEARLGAELSIDDVTVHVEPA